MDDMTAQSAHPSNAHEAHASLLDRLAEVAVRVGLGGLHPGQQLVMTASLEAVPLAADHRAAYRAGASLVTTLFADDRQPARFRHAPAGFDTAAGCCSTAWRRPIASGAARLAIVGDDPNLLRDRTREVGAREPGALDRLPPRAGTDHQLRHQLDLVACATPAWARAVFPELAEAEAMARLWDAIFAASRVTTDDPDRRLGGAQRHV